MLNVYCKEFVHLFNTMYVHTTSYSAFVTKVMELVNHKARKMLLFCPLYSPAQLDTRFRNNKEQVVKFPLLKVKQ